MFIDFVFNTSPFHRMIIPSTTARSADPRGPRACHPRGLEARREGQWALQRIGRGNGDTGGTGDTGDTGDRLWETTKCVKNLC
jgi:hypothetical protein